MLSGTFSATRVTPATKPLRLTLSSVTGTLDGFRRHPVEQIGDQRRFLELRQRGQGLLYNDFARRGSMAPQFNVLHRATCRTLRRANMAGDKYWFLDMSEAQGWLRVERGEPGVGWKLCGVCLTGSATGPTGNGRTSLTRPSTRAEPADQDLHHDFHVTADLEAGPEVNAWSVLRLPFEPKGSALAFRSALRTAIGSMPASNGTVLRAKYTSAVHDLVDLENVLLYNVGTYAFQRLATDGLVLERSFDPCEQPDPRQSSGFLHHHRYRASAEPATWEDWVIDRDLASFGPTRLPVDEALRRPERTWMAVKSGPLQIHGSARPGTALGLELQLEGPPTDLTALIKPLIDGVIAAFHRHRPGAPGDVAPPRLAAQLGISIESVRDLLADDTGAVLGGRKLIWPRLDGVQWNPADDRLVAIKMARRNASPGYPLTMTGRLSEVRSV